MVPVDTPIAHIEDVFNAVVTDGDFVGTTMYEGRGAGAEPTASAVVSDIVDIARDNMLDPFGMPTNKLDNMKLMSPEKRIGSYYVRFMVLDKPGVFATIAGALNDNNVSMQSILQRGRSSDEAVPVVLTTHSTDEVSMRSALEAIKDNGSVVNQPCLIRIENL